MKKQIICRSLNRSKQKRTMLALALVATTALGGCSQVPDAINPVEWYNSTAELLAGEDSPEATAEAEAPASETQTAEGAFPNISRVEQQRQARDNYSGGLVADIEGRKRAAAISRQGEAVKPLVSSNQTASSGATQPPPPAVPTVAVTTSQALAPVPSTMPATVAPQFDSAASTAQEKDFETRLKNRLAEIRARANQSSTDGQLSASPRMMSGQQETVVVSSNGVVTTGYGSNPVAAPMVTGSQFTGANIQNPAALPIPGKSVKVATIQFANGSAQLSSNDRRILQQVRKLAAERGGQIRIVGHASSRTRNLDPVSRKMANFEISIKRADKVASELVRLGLKKDSLLVGAVSDIMPQYYEYMPSGEAGNRRTEIYLDT